MYATLTLLAEVTATRQGERVVGNALSAAAIVPNVPETSVPTVPTVKLLYLLDMSI